MTTNYVRDVIIAHVISGDAQTNRCRKCNEWKMWKNKKLHVPHKLKVMQRTVKQPFHSLSKITKPHLYFNISYNLW